MLSGLMSRWTMPCLCAIGERVGHVAEDAYRLGDRELALARQLGAERLALDVRHDVVEEVPASAGGQEGHHVRVLQPGGHADFPLEPLDVDGRGGFRREHLDHHLALDLHLFGHEDPAHAAAAELAEDAVVRADRVLHLALEVGQAVRREEGVIE